MQKTIGAAARCAGRPAPSHRVIDGTSVGRAETLVRFVSDCARFSRNETHLRTAPDVVRAEFVSDSRGADGRSRESDQSRGYCIGVRSSVVGSCHVCNYSVTYAMAVTAVGLLHHLGVRRSLRALSSRSATERYAGTWCWVVAWALWEMARRAAVASGFRWCPDGFGP